MNLDEQRRRALYATRLLEHTATIVAAVRDDGPDELRTRIQTALSLTAPDGMDPVVALVTVLAAQVDPSATQEDLVGWTRGWSPVQVGLPDGVVHELDVQAVMAGDLPAASTSLEVRSEAVLRLLGQGALPHEVASTTSMSVRTVERIHARHRAGMSVLAGQRVAS